MYDKNIKIIDYIKRIYLIFNLNIIFSTCFPVNEMSCFFHILSTNYFKIRTQLQNIIKNDIAENFIYKKYIKYY